MKTENEFLRELERRAKEQKRVVETEVLPRWARKAGDWLVVNPWRVLVPLALLIYFGWRAVGGEGTREAVLAIFGGY